MGRAVRPEGDGLGKFSHLELRVREPPSPAPGGRGLPSASFRLSLSQDQLP
jgi:hypothetical protein